MEGRSSSSSSLDSSDFSPPQFSMKMHRKVNFANNNDKINNDESSSSCAFRHIGRYVIDIVEYCVGVDIRVVSTSLWLTRISSWSGCGFGMEDI